MFFRRSSSYLDRAKKRIGEIEKAVKTLERLARKAPAPPVGKRLMIELKKHNSQFQALAGQMKGHAREADARIKKLNDASAVSWASFRTALAKSRKAFARANYKAGKAIKRATR